MKIYNLKDLQQLSKKYNISLNEILLIYLNISGVNVDNFMPRIRSEICLLGKSENFYFGLANRMSSPFIVRGDYIIFDNKKIAEIQHVKNDDCASSYFRRNKSVLTLNSNKRSGCRGCKFCPNNLELNNKDTNLDTRDKILDYFLNILNCYKQKDLSFLKRLTICTGCFKDEGAILEHIISVFDVLQKIGFQGVIHYIGSQLTMDSSLDKIKDLIPNFMHTFTIECFSNREKILKKMKANISITNYAKMMDNSLRRGFTVNYIYILGLDKLKVFEQYSTLLSKHLNYFPLINLFQPHCLEHDFLKSSDANTLDYYLKARLFLEKVYSASQMRPQSWECYRPLWYFSFAQEYNTSIRI